MAFVVLAGTMVFTVLATSYVIRASHREDRLRFQKSTQNSTREIHDGIIARMDGYVALLRGVTGLFAAGGEVTRQRFHQYVDPLGLEVNYLGIHGIGYAQRATDGDLQALTSRAKSEELPAFHVWPEGAREQYFPILYFEPDDRRSLSAMGFDLFSDPGRREAMERARDTGAPAATGRVALIHDATLPSARGL